MGAAAIEFIVTSLAGDSLRITWDDESWKCSLTIVKVEIIHLETGSCH